MFKVQEILDSFLIVSDVLRTHCYTDWSRDCMEQRMNGSWDAYLASPADFARADDIITNLAKKREPGIDIIERTS